MTMLIVRMIMLVMMGVMMGHAGRTKVASPHDHPSRLLRQAFLGFAQVHDLL